MTLTIVNLVLRKDSNETYLFIIQRISNLIKQVIELTLLSTRLEFPIDGEILSKPKCIFPLDQTFYHRGQ